MTESASSSRWRGSADRVRTFLEARGLGERVLEFERSTKTAQMAAEAIGCELGQIVKSLVFVVDGVPVLALVAGDRRGDVVAIAREMAAESARFADADGVRRATGYAIGGVSPFDLPKDLDVLVDDSLGRFETLYPAGGTPSSTVRVSLDELLEVTAGRIVRISQ